MNILFIGNSYTMANNLTGILKELAEGKGKTIKPTVIARGGETFEGHSLNHESLSAMDNGTWDLVVLQEQSTRPIVEPDKMIRFGLCLRNRLGNMKTILYQTWARKRAPETQRDLNEAYNRLAERLDAAVAPVGITWAKVIHANPDLELFTEDGHHPSLLGSYVAACVLFATIFNETPVGLPHSFPHSDEISYVIDKDIATFVQSTAWECVGEFAKKN